MDPVGIPSGSRRDPVAHQFLHFWAPLLASRDPVGIQSGSSRAPMSGGSQIHKKQHFCSVFARFWVILAASRQVQTWCQKLENWCPTGSRLDPAWIPTGSRLDPDWRCPKMQNWCPTGSRLGPDWIRLGFFKKTPISLNLSTYFWNFSTLPCTTTPPLRTPPTSLKPNTGNSKYIYIYIYIYIELSKEV